MVTITQEEYDDLIEDAKILQVLRGSGVDNWEGYDGAMEALDSWGIEDDQIYEGLPDN